MKDAKEFFPWRVCTLLKFSRIRPISGRGAGDLGCLPSTADYDSRRLRCWRGELEYACFSFWPHLNNPWIRNGRTCLLRCSRKKGARGGAHSQCALENATVRVALRKLYTNHVAFGITTNWVFQQSRLCIKKFTNQIFFKKRKFWIFIATKCIYSSLYVTLFC